MKTDEEREKTPAYIVLCSTCQQMIGAHVDDGEHKRELSVFIAKHVKAGYAVERKTVADVRNAEWCICDEVTA